MSTSLCLLYPKIFRFDGKCHSGSRTARMENVLMFLCETAIVRGSGSGADLLPEEAVEHVSPLPSRRFLEG